MKDRIVQNPTRYRLTPVAGQSNQYDLEAVPGTITEQGTLLSKANILTDDTSELLGLTGDPTINDAFASLPAKIGDIKFSAAPQGNNWLECNGRLIDEADYPDLAPMLSAGGIKKLKPIAYSTFTVTGLEYINGYWIAYGSNGYIYYTTDFNGSWLSKRLYSGVTQTIHSFGYANGKYYAATSSYTFTASSPGGTWTRYSTTQTRLKYVNGYYVRIDSSTQGTVNVYYSDALSASGWTAFVADLGGAYERVYDIEYVSGMWVLCGDANTNSTYYPFLWYNPSLSATTWTARSNSYKSGAGWSFSKMTILEGMLYLGGRATPCFCYWNPATPAGTPERVSQSIRGSRIIKVDGEYYVYVPAGIDYYTGTQANENTIYRSDSLSEFETVPPPTSDAYTHGGDYFGGGNMATDGENIVVATTGSDGLAYIYTMSIKALPAISPVGAKAFIKAKQTAD